MVGLRKAPCLRIALFIVFGFLCLGMLGSLWVFEVVPKQAELSFGKPSPDIKQFQLTIYSFQLLSVRSQLTDPIGGGGGALKINIEINQSVTDISINLEKSGLIRSAPAFRLFLIYAGLDTGIQAGEYLINPEKNAMDIARMLQDATPLEVVFRILPGWRMEEIAAAIPSSGLNVKSEEFLAEARKPNPKTVPSSLIKTTVFEGFFYPDVYRFSRGISASELVAAFLTRFDERMTYDLKVAFQKQGLDLNQAVILASIIQREAMVKGEQPLLASVFLNRLKIKMKLDSDPTVQYALGYNQAQKTWWTNPLTTNNLKVNSPFNTYLFAGLPPTAISNPGEEALQAVAYPAQSPYFYFRAKCDQSGRHSFAITYEDHLKNGCP